MLTLDIDGTEQLALTKSVVVHPIRNYIEHADLLVIKRGEKVTVDVPVDRHRRGRRRAPWSPRTPTSSPSRPTRCNIPDQIEVSIEGAEIGTQILAGQLELPAGATLQTDAETLIVNVVTRRPPRRGRGREDEAAEPPSAGLRGRRGR